VRSKKEVDARGERDAALNLEGTGINWSWAGIALDYRK